MGKGNEGNERERGGGGGNKGGSLFSGSFPAKFLKNISKRELGVKETEAHFSNLTFIFCYQRDQSDSGILAYLTRCVNSLFRFLRTYLYKYSYLALLFHTVFSFPLRSTSVWLCNSSLKTQSFDYAIHLKNAVFWLCNSSLITQFLKSRNSSKRYDVIHLSIMNNPSLRNILLIFKKRRFWLRNSVLKYVWLCNPS